MKYTLYKTENGEYMLGRKFFLVREEFWSGCNWWSSTTKVIEYCMHNKHHTISNIKELIKLSGPMPKKTELATSDNLHDILNYLQKDLV